MSLIGTPTSANTNSINYCSWFRQERFMKDSILFDFVINEVEEKIKKLNWISFYVFFLSFAPIVEGFLFHLIKVHYWFRLKEPEWRKKNEKRRKSNTFISTLKAWKFTTFFFKWREKQFYIWYKKHHQKRSYKKRSNEIQKYQTNK